MLWPAVHRGALAARWTDQSKTEVSATGLFGPLQRFGIVNIGTNEGKELSEA